ncbi:SulP family inorganic anion transporter [Lampropedia puyangensis]|uniref:SulP family inorganic anion transporter n=1 Tax=Lampropedia puyangensis TaxID=1330072 RepID=A0A4S8F2C5_9BURK|nr:SulP family inorganic anion transporter [Lampropedia puyangensis]THT99291.1 SulP family inorganic anion transporter [Lampropedia puyangensis]
MSATGNNRTAAVTQQASWRLYWRELLAGVVTALALVPEVISFSVISGVDPKAALYASITLGILMSVLGGRPAMVTAAAGSVALVIGPMTRAHGVDYIFPAVLLAGVIQVLFGLSRLTSLVRYVPRSVMLGFVNALGILIFMAQVPHVLHQSNTVIIVFAAAILLTWLLPKWTTAVPSPLVAIATAMALVWLLGWQVPTVADSGNMAPGLLGFTQWNVPFNWQTLSIILPTALSIAFVGLLETLLTAQLVDEKTATDSNKNRESWALGVSNMAAGAYGGVAGCAMIGQTVVNIDIGGARTRLSTLAAALTMLLLVSVLSGLLALIPMASLAAVMVVVAIKTVHWRSLAPRTWQRMPIPETLVMLVTIVITVWTENLALGVGVGTVIALMLFARRVANATHVHRHAPEAPHTTVRYTISGPLFFASSHALAEQFDYAADHGQAVRIDLSAAQIWDATTVAALETVSRNYRAQQSTVQFVGLDARSRLLRSRLRGRL